MQPKCEVNEETGGEQKTCGWETQRSAQHTGDPGTLHSTLMLQIQVVLYGASWSFPSSIQSGEPWTQSPFRGPWMRKGLFERR